MNDDTQTTGQIYSVSVRTILDESWVRALEVEPVTTRRHYIGPRTVLTLRLADQSEMLGLLNRLHNMNLTVLNVELYQPEDPSMQSIYSWDLDME